ncbi:MAG TPA: DUF459 domain-containing protein [Acidimicrobiales bacterium]
MTPPRDDRRRVPAGQAIATMVVALLLAAVVDADGLVAVAERQPFGTTRDVALAVTRPLQRVADATRLNRPARWLADATDEDRPELATPVTLAPTTTATEAAPTTAAPPGEGRPGTTVPPPTTTTTTDPPRRRPTAEQPLRVWMAGDSLMGNLATAIGRMVSGDPRYDLRVRYEVGTGLARPDVLDWPATVAGEVQQEDPDVVILLFGGNDAQDMQADGRYLSFGSPEWQAEYRYRVALTMDQAAQGGRTVIWVGLPYTTRDELNQAFTIFNEIARTEAGKRDDVRFFDIVPALTPTGAFEEFRPDPDGGTLRARERDGVHVTIDGWSLVAPLLLATVADEYHLLPGDTG